MQMQHEMRPKLPPGTLKAWMFPLLEAALISVSCSVFRFRHTHPNSPLTAPSQQQPPPQTQQVLTKPTISPLLLSLAFAVVTQIQYKAPCSRLSQKLGSHLDVCHPSPSLVIRSEL